MLCVVGDLVEDVVVRLAGPPARGTDTVARIDRTRGGSAANVARAAVSAGCRARFVGRVGADQLGDRLIDDLARTGVDVCVQRGGRTGSVVVLVEPDGERTMLSDRGAAVDLAPIDASWLSGVTWLHVPAYSLCVEPIATSAREAIEVVRANGGGVSVDVSSVAVVEAYGTRRFTDLLGELAADVVFANGAEAALLADQIPGALVVKDGARPVVVRHADGREEAVPVDSVADVVDTTGAGDAFAGGFLAATLRGAGRRDAVVAGSALAARTLGAAGAALE